MAWYQFFVDYGWEIGGAIVIIALIFLAIYFGRKRRDGHTHNFIDRGFLLVNDKPRRIMICKICDVSIHVPILSRKQLKELEAKQERHSFKRRELKEEPIEDEDDW